MSIYIIIDKKQNKEFIKENDEHYKIITAKEYITNSSTFLDEKKAYIINLCSSYKYQSIGYYVSLLAEARGHKPLPEVLQIQDLKSLKVLRKVANQCSELIEKSLCSITSEHFELSVYFGKNIALRHERLSNELFQLLKIPLFKVYFVRDKTTKSKNSWKIKGIQQLKIEEIPQEHYEFFNYALNDYINLKKKFQKKIKHTHYDLAILINPDEKNPPSNEKALMKFQTIGKKMGFNVEFLYPDDMDRLAEFDALFIRETTAVNHHTYQFSRLAEAMGLIVIDDPNSILKCSNKVFLTELLVKNKIKIPETYILYKSNYTEIADQLEYPCVLKQPDSAFSLGVVKVSDKKEFIQETENLFKTSELLLVQKFIYTDFDWRIGVLNKKPLFACKYYMAKNHWQIYNWNSKEDKEGKFQTLPIYMVPDKVVEVAIKASSLIGEGLYGVDIKEVQGEPYVMEVNDNPSIDSGIEDDYDGNKLYEEILKYFYDKIQHSKNS